MPHLPDIFTSTFHPVGWSPEDTRLSIFEESVFPSILMDHQASSLPTEVKDDRTMFSSFLLDEFGEALPRSSTPFPRDNHAPSPYEWIGTELLDAIPNEPTRRTVRGRLWRNWFKMARLIVPAKLFKQILSKVGSTKDRIPSEWMKGMPAASSRTPHGPTVM